MDYPNRLEWQTRCEFNAYCKRTLRNELIDACRKAEVGKSTKSTFQTLPRMRKSSFIPLTDILSMRTRTLFVQAV